MYLVLALLAPIVMFLLIPGLSWLEDRMLGSLTPPPPTPLPVPSTARPAIEPAAPTPTPVALPTVPRPAGHTVRSGRPRHARRSTSLLAYRHHIGRRRPPRAPVFR
ncbi:hypothetical protein OG948_16920 [Embleya sp. NBC_00888]|uniref:hypothetical protein n=1 Tax=Embleya sp. NBC_00888 TaxID=2975960 RepID=UPI00386A09B2|nr:hypothetical protein OG948_16920 [Embleya sp. NBC_00888]